MAGVITEIAIISIHALLAESDDYYEHIRQSKQISIHALLAESDQNRPRPSTGIDDFYPRSPCGERPMQIVVVIVRPLFLSTLSLRRATTTDMAKRLIELGFLSTLSLRRATAVTTLEGGSLRDFYPRSPCGERRRPKALKSRRCVFLSTLSLRRATGQFPVRSYPLVFLSTLSLRRAT